MRTLISIAALFACTASWPVMAQNMGPLLPPNGDMALPQDDRIKILPYDETDVYTITAKPGYQTNIVFGHGEEIQTISVGERSFWQIIPNNNRLFIRPLNEDISTNMTVITNRHSYQFDLKSLPAGEDTGNIYVAKFTYNTNRPAAPLMPFPPVRAGAMPMMTAPAATMMPSAVPAAPLPAIAPAQTAAPAAMPSFSTMHGSLKPPHTPPPCVPPECIPPGANEWSPQTEREPYVAADAGPGISHPVGPNFNYTYSGPDDLSPLQVYDDGQSTYIKYRHSKEPLPNVYLVNSDGSESPTTYYIKGGAMVVDTVAPEIALKSRSGTVYIYNELLNPQ